MWKMNEYEVSHENMNCIEVVENISSVSVENKNDFESIFNTDSKSVIDASVIEGVKGNDEDTLDGILSEQDDVSNSSLLIGKNENHNEQPVESIVSEFDGNALNDKVSVCLQDDETCNDNPAKNFKECDVVNSNEDLKPDFNVDSKNNDDLIKVTNSVCHKRHHDDDLLDSKNSTCCKPLHGDTVAVVEPVEKRMKSCESPVHNGDINDLVTSPTISKKRLLLDRIDTIVQKQVQQFIKVQKVDIISELQKQIEDLKTANTVLMSKYKELQRQIVEASIVKQRMKHKAANNKIQTKNICIQVDEKKLQASQRQQSLLSTPIQSQLVHSPSVSQSTVVPTVQNSSPYNQAQVKNGSSPTVRQLISTQKAVATNAGIVPTPNILRHSLSIPQVVDLTDDDDLSVKSNGPLTALLKNKSANQVSQISVSNGSSSRIERSLAPNAFAAATRPVQTVVAVQVASPVGLTTNSFTGQPLGQQTCYVAQNYNSSVIGSATMTKFNGNATLLQTLSPVTLISSSANVKVPIQSSVNSSKTTTSTSNASILAPLKHPAPLPAEVKEVNNSQWKPKPPVPSLKIQRVEQGIVLSWNILPFNKDEFAEIVSYELYAYQESTAPPSSNLWKKVGDVKALPLPMACTLTQFQERNTYHFAVRAVDMFKRFGNFSEPSSIYLSAR